MTSGLSWCAVGSNGTADEEIVQMKPKRARLKALALPVLLVGVFFCACGGSAPNTKFFYCYDSDGLVTEQFETALACTQ